jgi:hypothetical protein
MRIPWGQRYAQGQLLWFWDGRHCFHGVLVLRVGRLGIAVFIDRRHSHHVERRVVI